MTAANPQSSPQDSGPNFGKVFSVTFKVFLALVLISAIVGAIFLVLGGLGRVANKASENGSSVDRETRKKQVAIKSADRFHTLVPLSEWNKIIAAATKVHCPVEGMTKEEVQNAIGKPVAADLTTWRYQRTVEKKCTTYTGDKCAEPTQQIETENFSFTPSGHLLYPESDHSNDWLQLNCFGEPFYSRYYQPLARKHTERVLQDLEEMLHGTEAK